ncbi:hypothetical protein QJS10_CPB14g01302 [Acorus calamus]|uniref:Exo_endo_phos domain-containing protein n=1 Tax=Acorus calamus TaxID=4465 RepID=A0AAV9DAZ1_ACOCL|nr:hypothetical protein QJS10_CPB14g01302 [Acorus calamus]
MEEISSTTIRLVGGGTLDVRAAKGTEAASGGIVNRWDSGKWSTVDRVEGEFSISVLLECRLSGWKWACSCVYGPLEDGPRDHLWEELFAVLAVWSAPWLIIGDFNVTRFPEDRNRHGPIDAGMAGFSSWINEEEQGEPHAMSRFCFEAWWTSIEDFKDVVSMSGVAIAATMVPLIMGPLDLSQA